MFDFLPAYTQKYTFTCIYADTFLESSIIFILMNILEGKILIQKFFLKVEYNEISEDEDIPFKV